MRAIPRNHLTVIVGNLYVFTPDEEVVRFISARVDNAPVAWTEAERKRAIRYALALHHHNQTLVPS